MAMTVFVTSWEKKEQEIHMFSYVGVDFFVLNYAQ